MNKLVLGVLAVILFVVGGIFIFAAQQKTPLTKQQQQNAVNQSSTTENQQTAKSNNRYVDYSPQIFAETKDKKRVLFFYASWCPTCIPADAAFQANSQQIPENVAIIRVNYNDPDTDADEKTLAQKYGITYQHTFVQVDQDGREITKWNGGKIDELLANVK